MCSNPKIVSLDELLQRGLLYPLRVRGLGRWEHWPSMRLCTRKEKQREQATRLSEWAE